MTLRLKSGDSSFPISSLWLSSLEDYNIHNLAYILTGFNVRTALTPPEVGRTYLAYRSLYTLKLATHRTDSRPYRITPINSRGNSCLWIQLSTL